jgi:predicted GH43/DUF377 family glycosyl hydrolase
MPRKMYLLHSRHRLENTATEGSATMNYVKTDERWSETTGRALLERFHEAMDRTLETLGEHRDLEVVIGIPFHDEVDTLGGVINTARDGIEKMGLANKSVVLCAGPERAHAAFDTVMEKITQREDVPVHDLMLNGGLDGRGWSVRAMMVAATRFRAPLILLPPNLLPASNRKKGTAVGFSPEWIERLYEPMTQDQDLALARFNRHPLAQPVESFLAYPVIAAVLGFRLRQPTPGVFAMSQKLIHMCLAAGDPWPSETGAYGFDAWLATRALAENLSVCEVPLGPAFFRHEVGKLKLVFHQVAHAVLSEIALHENEWLDRSGPLQSASVSGPRLDVAPPDYDLRSDQLRRRFKLEFNHFDETLFRAILPDDLRERMERQADAATDGVSLSADEWILILRRFILAYRFEEGFHRDDIVDGLFPFFLARLATFIDEYHSMKEHLSSSGDLSLESARRIARHEAERVIQNQMEIFVARWPEFRDRWKEREKEISPYLARLGAWQFIPNVDVIVPQELEVPGGHSVWAYQVYKDQIDRYRDQFKLFISERLGIDDYTRSREILEGVESFMYRLDRLLDTDVFPYDITTVDGARKMSEKICRHFVEGQSFCLTGEAAENLILEAPPRNLITRLDVGNVRGLLERFEPHDALGLAAWTDQQRYLYRVLDIIETDGQAGWFENAQLKPTVVDLEHLANTAEVGGSAALARLAGRVVAANTQRGAVGKLPKLWYMLRLIKAIVGVELFSGIWRGFADEGFHFGHRLGISIREHWGRRVMSAHNAFENRHQHILVERLEKFAETLRGDHAESAQAADALAAAASVYHLSITLPDATFVPLSAWTWASFSNRGGVGVPTPLSSLVERDWATRDFITSYLERTGRGDAKTIDKKIVELIGQGRESEDLGEHLLGVEVDLDSLVVRQKPQAVPPPAARMVRPLDGPMFEAIPEHPWESRYVLNAAAVRLEGNVYILYRAYGDDEKSRIGLVWSKDGIHVDGRLDQPIFEPAEKTERDGCEDPRVVEIDGRLWMLYTAWDREVAQIALASIDTKDFLDGRFDRWERHGLGFPRLANKDAVLYPEKFDGKYALYHRLDPNMWITYMDELTCPWPREGQKIIISPRAGMMWDGVKIGAGAQPIKTTRGWLNIYHGVDYDRSYRLGVLFTPLDDPAEVIYRSPNPVLEPETEYELGHGDGRDSWVPHVVFTCGAVPAQDKEIVGPEDEVLVYYGAADTAMGVASARVRDLVPIIDSL